MRLTGLLTLLLFILGGAEIGPVDAAPGKGVADSAHNLSVTGPGNIKASGEAQVCIFCHVGHNSSPAAPLWNRHKPGSGYIPYSSSTVATSPGDPTGSSLLCLSCHDGTIALGKLVSRKSVVDIRGGPNMPPGRYNLTKDLSDDHPISFDYHNSQSAKPGELVPISSLSGPVRLDQSGQLQCTSCHDAHDNQYGKFLVTSPSNGELCLSCHIKEGWPASSHANASASWEGKSVAEHACQSCHVPHGAEGKERLLRNQAEEDVCLACHDGLTAAKDVKSEFRKISRHPVDATTGTHDPGEAAITNSRHVECVDCHNAHATSSSGLPSGPLTMIRGINQAGNEVFPIANEYQLCFRCHADNFNKPPPLTSRVWDDIDGTNLRLEFSSGNASYHPVTSVATNFFSPSLQGMSQSSGSTIGCGDCHGNDDINGPSGPHGSSYAPLLIRQNIARTQTPESPSAYALCYGCHSRSSILADESFPEHDKHIRDERTACTACHDPHASDRPRLINFDASMVTPNSDGVLEYISNGPGTFSGSCSLSCHNKDHNPETY